MKLQGGVSRLPEIISRYGRNIFILFDPLIFERYGNSMSESLKREGYNVKTGVLKRDCCEEEGHSHEKDMKDNLPDCVIGVGGGKAIDLAKWIAGRLARPFISIPTSAATCAATTSISAMYTPDGHYLKTVPSASPAITLVDPDILVTQPWRLLSAGMADAMAKWIEARGMRKRHHKRILSASALSLARITYEFLTKRGTRALEDLDKGKWTKTLDEIIDINLFITGLISTLGGRSVRVSAAHAFQDAFCGLGSKRDTLHGEWVAFGLILQMVLEKTTPALIKRHLFLFNRWGLPLTLEELGIGGDENLIDTGIKKMMGENSPIHNLLMPVNAEQVRETILGANRLGREIKGG